MKRKNLEEEKMMFKLVKLGSKVTGFWDKDRSVCTEKTIWSKLFLREDTGEEDDYELDSLPTIKQKRDLKQDEEMMLKRFYEDYHGMNGMKRKHFVTQVTTNHSERNNRYKQCFSIPYILTT